MKKRLALFGWMGLFWMLFFVVSRIMFLLYNHDRTADLSAIDVLTLMTLGLRMDAAMSGYWLALTGLMLTASCIWSRGWFPQTHRLMVIFLLLISSLIVVGDLELYRNWGFRMDTTPLMYVGSEGAGSIQMTDLIKLVVLFLSLVASFYLLYQKKLARKATDLPDTQISSSLVMFAVSGLLFFPIRSSLSVAPLNTGAVYFHRTIAFANHAGINVVWNFFKSLTTYNHFKYPENLIDDNLAKATMKELTQGTQPPVQMLNTARPNILLIILESFTAKIIEPLGGEPGITPQFNKLAHEGILFDNFYASGDRTDKGIVSILSGYPAQPKTTIIKFPQKTQNLPYLSRSLNALGYHTSFVYGGDIGFANMESYVTTGGFSHVTEDDDFDAAFEESKWGLHDHIVFERLLQECDSASSPFFKVMLSLSSHEPFDVPLDPPFMAGKDDASLFLNACYYTDQSLGKFITEAKQKDWWKNTWVIVTADHGHRFPNAEELKEKERFKIPMLWLGGALTKQDTIIHTFASQTDIANTILGQVAESKTDFEFSRDIFTGPPSFAIYLFQNGYGYIDGQSELIYDFDFNSYLKENGNEQSTIRSKAFVQTLFSDYNRR
jgi:phosphoglycerol transferase MdoB-like AlkP superfamily enzyme